MSNNLLTIDADATAILSALDRLSDTVAFRHVKAVANVTAELIADGARSRVARRTGETAEGIVVREDYTGEGYVVVSERDPFTNLPIWLEFGTMTMVAHPYMFNSARLEEEPHRRRLAQELTDAIAEVGLA